MNQLKTNLTSQQEEFWAGKFGDEYITRNQTEELIKSNLFLFSTILSKVNNIESIIEFGANIGLNITAIKALLPQIKISAVEINEQAASYLKKSQPEVNVFHQSIMNFVSKDLWDLVLIKAVLIHINPCFLPKVYEILHLTTKRYLCIAEYYNPSPVEVSYRNYKERLFKRDFAGEMLDLYSDLRLIDYGFTYHKDGHSADDLNWFLLEKYK